MLFRCHTLGCKLNFAETSDIARQLRSRGFAVAGPGEKADVVLLNTCSVTDVADHKGRQAIHRLHRENSDALLVVTGCYAQLRSSEVAAIEGVDLVLGQADKFRAVEHIEQMLAERKRSGVVFTSDIRAEEQFCLSVSHDDRTRHFLKVQDGCDYFCTYCTIPFARGKSRSATIEQVVNAAQKAIAEGAKEIVLTGVNTGDFGRRNGESFYDLLRRLDDIDAEVRYRISSVEPNLLTDQIIGFVAESRHFAPHFHIPLQSGSDHVLRLMHRRYDTALFASKVSRILERMPYAFIGVDVMVGVRGETRECFDDARRFVEELPVSQLHVFTYSERAGTAMLDIPDAVPQRERKRRSDVLHDISARKLKAFYELNKGREATVLWEGKRQNGMMSGFTENYVRVTAPYNASLVNTFCKIIV